MEDFASGAVGAPRDLERDDVPALCRFVVMASFRPGYEPTAEELAAGRVRRWLDGWPGEDDAGVGWEERGRLRGAAWARCVEPVLVRTRAGSPLPELIVAVDEDARGHGIGRALVSALADRAAARGWPGLALTVSPRNPAALAIYRRRGFTEMSGGEGRQGLVVMALSLDPSAAPSSTRAAR